MATQHCPRCKSSRVRHGYRPTPLFRKLMCRFNLLCNDCNWEFVGFAIPGTVPSKTKRKKKLDEFNEPPKVETSFKLDNEQPEEIVNLEIVPSEKSENLETTEMAESQEILSSQTNNKPKSKVRKRVRIEFT